MKSLMQLLSYVLADASDRCCTSTTRDVVTISRRVEHEGLSFITITLPAFAKDFERSLELGRIVPGTFLGFKKSKKGSSLPAFLQGLMGLVFDSTTGVVLSEPSVDAIFFIRQACLLFKKLQYPCSDARIQKAFKQFRECENEIKSLSDNADWTRRVDEFRRASRMLWNPVLSGVNDLITRYEHIPRHGPGATAERISGNGKYDIRRWHSRLEPFFPSDMFTIPNVNFLEEAGFDLIEPGAEQPVRVIAVPKTLKTPRIIAIEPVCMQYTQQSILELLVPAIERHPLTKGSVNFTDQKVNQDEALSSSRTGSLATLDLSEASDRVSNQLVESMLETLPELSGAVQACRSTSADVPSLGILPLAKYASMGSALCFPMEAMVFYTIILMGLAKAKHTRLTLSFIKKHKRQVRVYGDDLIVPVDCVLPVIDLLEAYGLKVNRTKTFWNSKFRESCGVDAWDGYRITPVYCRRILTRDRRDGSIPSWVALANHLYKGGMWKAAQYARQCVENILGELPHVCEDSPALGWFSFLGTKTIHRWNKQLHRQEVYAPVYKVVQRPSRASGLGALLKFFLKRGVEPYLDPKHLERLGRSSIANIKSRWVPIY